VQQTIFLRAAPAAPRRAARMRAVVRGLALAGIVARRAGAAALCLGEDLHVPSARRGHLAALLREEAVLVPFEEAEEAALQVRPALLLAGQAVADSPLKHGLARRVVAPIVLPTVALQTEEWTHELIIVPLGLQSAGPSRSGQLPPDVGLRDHALDRIERLRLLLLQLPPPGLAGHLLLLGSLGQLLGTRGRSLLRWGPPRQHDDGLGGVVGCRGVVRRRRPIACASCRRVYLDGRRKASCGEGRKQRGSP